VDPGADRTALGARRARRAGEDYGALPALTELAALVEVATLVEVEALVELEQSASARPYVNRPTAATTQSSRGKRAALASRRDLRSSSCAFMQYPYLSVRIKLYREGQRARPR
jgi:hypothetical protein